MNAAWTPKIWQLWPNRALDRKGVRRLIAFFALLLIAGAVRTYMMGAWPVALFLLLDLAAICLALYISVTRARWSERIELTPGRLIITRTLGDVAREEVMLGPQNTTVRIVMRNGLKRLQLTDARKLIEVGSFLTDPDLEALKSDLEEALRDWDVRPFAAVTQTA